MDLGSLVSGTNGVVAGAILGLIQGIKLAVPKFFSSKTGQRVSPLIPIVLGVLATVCGAGDLAGADPTVANKVVVGLLIGASAGQLFKVGKTSVMGHGVEDKTPEPKPLVEG